MRNPGKYFFSIVLGIIMFLSMITDWHVLLTLSLCIVLLAMMLDKLGKGIILRELIAFHGTIICVLMPLTGYLVYNREHALARLWVKYMPVPEDVYFNFALPAMAAFSLAICWPVNGKEVSDTGKLINEKVHKIQQILITKPKIGIYLIVIGIVVFRVSEFVPAALTFVATLFYWAAFAGFLCVFYMRNYKYRMPILIGFSVFILVDAIRAGMFTIVAYMSITIFSFFFIHKKKVSFTRKLSLFLIGSFSLILIQSVKSTYRSFTWLDNYQGNKVVLFTDLITDKLSSPSQLFTVDAFFPIYYRINQGYNVGLVMRKIPRIQDYDYGRTMGLSFASAFVPRLFWPDKPEAGGRFNMSYYAGVNLRNWSTNIGPLGEAYGSFGPQGGVVLMFLLGIFIRFIYSMLFRVSNKVPLLLFWIPVIFYQVTYSMETDMLQIFNSLFKGAFFVYVLYRVFPQLFGVEDNRRGIVVKKTGSELSYK